MNHDRAGNAYGSPAAARTNQERGGYGRDAAGGGTVNRFSASTRKAAPLSKDEYQSSIAKGVAPNAAKGSKAQVAVTNKATGGYGESMAETKSTYKASRKQGMSPDDARGVALSGKKMTRDAYGKQV